MIPSPITDEIFERYSAAYKSGATCHKIAKDSGISKAVWKRRLISEGIYRVGGKNVRRWNSGHLEQAIGLKAQNKTMTQIANRLCFSSKLIAEKLKEAGVIVGKVGRPAKAKAASTMFDKASTVSGYYLSRPLMPTTDQQAQS